MKHWFCIAVISLFTLSCIHRNVSNIEPSNLKCEYSDNPLAIENQNPELSWILNSEMRNQKQSAYHILVASSRANIDSSIGDLWGSDTVNSEESVHIEYRGKPLVSGMRCWWKVCVWDEEGVNSDWSKPAFWKMGLLDPNDWKAQWISYECQSAPLLRKRFKINENLKEARVYISGLGYYELHINGIRIGDHVLDPAQTDYEQGWDTPGYDDADWDKVVISEGPEIQLRFAESLFKDGMIDPARTGVYATDVVQTDKYICNGKDVEVWEPCFTYHGFRYIEMTGFPGEPGAENIQGVFVHTAVEKTGEFISSDTMINKLHQTALWTELSNMHGIPTDCSHRERCGWLGDAFLTSDMTMYNFDVALLWRKCKINV